MNTKKAVYQTPVASTEFSAEATFCTNVIRFSYQIRGSHQRSGLRFRKVKMTRTRAESACTAWHIEGAYDTLVEIEGSTWAAELQRETAEWQMRMGERWMINHYMIYLDSVGCFEFLAESWDALPEESGNWGQAQI